MAHLNKIIKFIPLLSAIVGLSVFIYSGLFFLEIILKPKNLFLVFIFILLAFILSFTNAEDLKTQRILKLCGFCFAFGALIIIFLATFTLQ